MSKAEVLNKQFCSVFTKENNNIPIMNSRPYPPMNNIVFSINGIQRLLQNLKPGKAAGPDSTYFYLDSEIIMLHPNSTHFTNNIYAVS